MLLNVLSLIIKGRINKSTLKQFQNTSFEDFQDDASDCTPSDDITSTFNDIIEEIALRPSNIEEGSNVIVQMLLNCKDERVFHSIVDSLFEKVVYIIIEQSGVLPLFFHIVFIGINYLLYYK